MPNSTELIFAPHLPLDKYHSITVILQYYSTYCNILLQDSIKQLGAEDVDSEYSHCCLVEKHRAYTRIILGSHFHSAWKPQHSSHSKGVNFFSSFPMNIHIRFSGTWIFANVWSLELTYEHIWEKDQHRDIHMGTVMNLFLAINALSKQSNRKWPGELDPGTGNNLRSSQLWLNLDVDFLFPH